AGGGYGWLAVHPDRLAALLGPKPPPAPPQQPIALVTPPPPPPPVETPIAPPPVETPAPPPVAGPRRREKPVTLTTRELGGPLARVRPQVQSCFEHNRPKAAGKLEVELSIAN